MPTNSALPRLHLRLYLVCPNQPYKQVKSLLNNFDKLIQPYKDDPTAIVVNLNSEDEYAKAFIQDYQTSNPDVQIGIKYFEPEFNKHKKLAYVKRNKKCILRSSHILILHAERPTIGQEYISRQVEDLDKHLLIWRLTPKKEEKTDGQE